MVVSTVCFVSLVLLRRVYSQAHGQGESLTAVVATVNVSDVPLTEVRPYILAECTSGLSNRLRVLAAYMHVAEVKFSARLAFIWDVNSACPGRCNDKCFNVTLHIQYGYA